MPARAPQKYKKCFQLQYRIIPLSIKRKTIYVDLIFYDLWCVYSKPVKTPPKQNEV